MDVTGSVGLNTKFVVEAMAARGHNVTFVIPDTLSNIFSDDVEYNLIKVENVHSQKDKDEILDLISSNALQNTTDRDIFIQLSNKVIPMLTGYHTKLLNDRNLLNQLRNQTFDLAFFESFFIEFAYIANAIKVPYVIMDPMVTNPYIAWLMRGDRNPATYPGDLLDLHQHMNFIQRLQSTVENISGFIKYYLFLWMLQPSSDSSSSLVDTRKPFSQLINEAELWFVRTHSALDFPRLLPPHVIPMGGQMARPAQRLQPVSC